MYCLSLGTFEILFSLWRNLDTQNRANLRILREPSKEWAEPWMKNTGLWYLAALGKVRFKSVDIVLIDVISPSLVWEHEVIYGRP